MQQEFEEGRERERGGGSEEGGQQGMQPAWEESLRILERASDPAPTLISSFWIGRSNEEITPPENDVGRVPTMQIIYGAKACLGFFLV